MLGRVGGDLTAFKICVSTNNATFLFAFIGGMGPREGGLGINRQNMNPTELAELGIQLAVAALQQTKQQVSPQTRLC